MGKRKITLNKRIENNRQRQVILLLFLSYMYLYSSLSTREEMVLSKKQWSYLCYVLPR